MYFVLLYYLVPFTLRAHIKNQKIGLTVSCNVVENVCWLLTFLASKLAEYYSLLLIKDVLMGHIDCANILASTKS